MGKKCVVPKCKSGLETCKEKVSMFSIPKNKLEIWQKALPDKNRRLTYKDTVCEKHFRKSDIIREIRTSTYAYSLQVAKLTPSAVPSVFPVNSNYQLRPRASSSKSSSSKTRTKTVLKTNILRPLSQDEILETVSEEAFRTMLQKHREIFKNCRNLTKQRYDALVHQTLQAKKKVPRKQILKRYNVLFDGNDKILTTAGKGPVYYYAHDDELFNIFRSIHMLFNHAGRFKMMAKLKTKYKNIVSRDVDVFLSLCHTCTGKEEPEECIASEDVVCTSLSSRCSINFLDYQPYPDGDYQFVMVYQNHVTKFCFLKPLILCVAAEVAKNLVDIFSFFGASTIIQSMKGSSFWEKVFLRLQLSMPNLVIEHVQLSTGNKILHDVNKAIKNLVTASKEWVERLPFIQFQLNQKSDNEIERAPYYALFNLAKMTNAQQKETSLNEINTTEIVSCKICLSCENIIQKEESCRKCMRKKIFQLLLPTSYQIWEDPSEETSEKNFWEKINQLDTNHSFPKIKYDELLARIEKSKKGSYSNLDNFSIAQNKDIKGLTNDDAKYYVHDDELFYILHYTHINLNHATCRRMIDELGIRFHNISYKDVSLYVSLCPTCKSYEPPIHNELNSRCSINFIYYQSSPDGKFKYVMIYQNSLTNFCMLQPLVSKTAEEVATNLIDIFTFVGSPKLIESRKEVNYAEEVMKWSFLETVIKKLNHTWLNLEITQVQIEDELEDITYIQEGINAWMKKNNTRGWSKGLPFVQLMQNRNYHPKIEMIPYDSFFGFTKVHLDSNANACEENENTLINLLIKLYSFPYKAVWISEATKKIFQNKLKILRKKTGYDDNLSKETYKKLVFEVATTRKSTIYDVIKFQGIPRLILPPFKRDIMFYVHDDELFTIFEYTHLRLNHADSFKMKINLETRFVNISLIDIRIYCRLCPTCANKEAPSQEPAAYSLLSYKCSVDIIDCESSSDECKFILLYQNKLTKFSLLKPLKTKEPVEVAANLIDIFTFIGICMVIESQEGYEFVKNVAFELKLLWHNLDVKYDDSGESSEHIRQLKEDVKKRLTVNRTTPWSKSLPFVQFALNKKIHRQIQSTPHEKIFSKIK